MLFAEVIDFLMYYSFHVITMVQVITRSDGAI